MLAEAPTNVKLLASTTVATYVPSTLDPDVKSICIFTPEVNP